MKDMYLNIHIKRENIAIFIIALVIYQFVYGVSTMVPSNVSWLLNAYHDWGQHYLGWAFYRQEAWQFPIGDIQNYQYPSGTNITFTDSIPLFAVFFKLINGLLPDTFQYFGVFMFVNLYLAGLYTYKILKHYGLNNVLIFISAIFIMSNPAWIFRGMHPALTAHWFILASFYHYLCLSDFKKALIYQWILILFSAMIHPYLMTMIAGFSIILPWRFYPELKGKKSVFLLLLYPIISYISVVLLWWVIGTITFDNAYGTNSSDNIFGISSYNLNGFFDSMGHYSTLLGDLPNTSEGQHEGFSYLGLGLIIFMIIGLSIVAYNRFVNHIKYIKIQHIYLIVLVSFISLFAISNRVTFGDQVLITYWVPEFVKKLGSIFRANGRYIWPLYYLVILISFYGVNQLKKNNIKKIIFFSLLLIQLIDIKPLLFARKLSHERFDMKILKDDNKWDYIISHFDKIYIQPPFENNLSTQNDYQDFCYLAQKNRIPISNGYVAREKRNINRAFLEQSTMDLLMDIIDTTAVYITNSEHLKYFSELIATQKVNTLKIDNYWLLFTSDKLPVELLSETNKYNDSIISVLKLNTNNYTLYDIPNTNNPASIDSNIELFLVGKNKMIIKGWATFKNTKKSFDSIRVILKSDNTSYKLNAKTKERKDVADYFKNPDLAHSGFETTLYFKDLQKNNYDLGIELWYNNESSIKFLDHKLPLKDLFQYRTEKVNDFIPTFSELKMNIEKFETNPAQLIIGGWAFLEGNPSENLITHIIMRKDSTFYSANVKSIIRDDVSAHFNQTKMYDASGFYSEIDLNEIPRGSYSIGIELYDQKSGRSFYKETGQIIENN